MSREIAVSCFKSMLGKHGAWSPLPLPWPRGKVPTRWTTVEDVKRELRGKNLACWCPLPASGEPDHCHAAVLLQVANAEPEQETR